VFPVIFSASVTEEVVYTESFYIHSSTTASFVRLRVASASGSLSSFFNFSTKLFGTKATGAGGGFAGGTTTELPNGWFFVEIQYTPLTGDTGGRGFSISATTADNSATADTGANLVVWQVQLEQGAFPTSPIYTAGAAALRARDIATITDLIAMGYNANQGSLTVEFIVPPLVSGTFPCVLAFSDGGFNNRFNIAVNGSTGGIVANFTAGGVSQADLDTTTFAAGSIVRAALSWDANSFKIAINGVGYAEDTSGTVPTGITQLDLGNLLTINYLNSHIRELPYYPRSPSQAELNRRSAR
jgi:hypothetical protein